jgi:hypothetical protein
MVKAASAFVGYLDWFFGQEGRFLGTSAKLGMFLVRGKMREAISEWNSRKSVNVPVDV